MAVKFSNNAKTTLSSALSSSATSVSVADASKFPTLGTGDYTYATIAELSNSANLEIVKVTAISSNTLTVVRAQQGTSALSFSSGDLCEVRVTAGTIEEAITDVSDTLATVATTGAYSDLSGTPSLATVATSGAYSDLTGAPTNVSSFTNDSGYLTSYTETDPVFTASAASGITSTNISNWNTAYGWGDHSTAGYLTSYTETDTLADVTGRGNTTTNTIATSNNVIAGNGQSDEGYFTGQRIYRSASGGGGLNFTNINTIRPTDNAGTNTNGSLSLGENSYRFDNGYFNGLVTASGGNSNNWNTAYGWGNHASAGYLTSYTETDTLNSVTGRGSTTTNSISIASLTASGTVTFSGHRLAQGNVANNTELRSNAGSAAGLVQKNNAGTFMWQLYGDSSNYGFLTAEWGSWDIKKIINGEMTVRVSGTDRTVFHSNNLLNANQNITGHWEWQDSKNIRFGNSADSRMWWNGSENRWYHRNYTHGSNMLWQAENASGTNVNMFYLDPDDGGYLYHGGSVKLQSVSGGVNITGNLDASNAVYSADWFRTSSGNGGWYHQSYGGGIHMQDTTWVRVYNSKRFYVSNTSASGAIAAAGDIVAYYSDERLKEKTGSVENALDKVCSLEAFTYTHNEIAKANGFEGDEEMIGLSAQQVEAICPQVVKPAPFDIETAEDGTMSSKSGEDYKTVKYERLVPLLVEAIKDLKAEIEELKNGAS